MQTIGQSETFFGNSDQHVSADRDPDLRLDRVLGRTKKCLDPQMLLDPFEEQFDLPALPIQACNQFGFESKVVGQKRNAFAGLVLDHHAAQRDGIILAGIENRQHPGLVANNVRLGAIYRAGVAALELGVGFGSSYKEGIGLMDGEQPLEIEIAPIEQVVGAGLDDQIVQGVDLVRLAVADMNKCGYSAAQIEQGVEFDSRFVRSKRRPWINRQTQIDRRRVEGVDRGVQVDRQRILCIQGSCHGDQMLGKVGVDLPRPCSVGIGQRIARNSLAAQPHVIKPLGLGAQIDFDIAQRFAVGQLGKSHGQELIHAGEVLDLVIAAVLGYAPTKSTQRQKGHELRKNQLALVHGDPLRMCAKDSKAWRRRSNRDQTEMPKIQGKSSTYDVLMSKRWDTTDPRYLRHQSRTHAIQRDRHP